MRTVLVVLLVVVTGCSSTVDEPSITSTTRAPTTTTTTQPVRQAINLGQHPSDVVYCRGKALLLKGVGAELHIYDIPGRNDQVEGWALEHPDEFALACALLSFRRHSSEVSDRINRVYGGDATEVIEQGLDDTERVWCYEHWEDVVSAAGVLAIGPSQRLPEQLKFGRREVDRVDGGDTFVMWAMLNPDAYVRSCQAAFGAR